MASVSRLYQWSFHDKVMLGFASVLCWVPLSWAFLGDGLYYVFSLTKEMPEIYMQVAFVSYVGVCVALHMALFGVMAYRYPGLYILPAWILTLWNLMLGLRKIALFVLLGDDPEKARYFGADTALYGHFTGRDVYVPMVGAYLLFLLSRAAFRYAGALRRGDVDG